MVFSIFAELCNHCHYLISEHFHPPKKTCTHQHLLPIPPCPGPSPWRPLIYIPFVWICLFHTFISEIIQSVHSPTLYNQFCCHLCLCPPILMPNIDTAPPPSLSTSSLCATQPTTLSAGFSSLDFSSSFLFNLSELALATSSGPTSLLIELEMLVASQEFNPWLSAPHRQFHLVSYSVKYHL